MKYRLAWQDTGTIYELISTDLGYAQLRNIKLNTIKWSEVRHLIAHKE